MAIKLIIAGCCGRMGQAIARCALQDSVFAIGAAFEAPGHASLGKEYGTVLGHPSSLGVSIGHDAKAALSSGDVLIEFTTPEVTVEHARLAQQACRPMVIGTTGLSEAHVGTLREAAKAIPIVFSPNMSLGVNVLCELAQLAAQRLGLGYDVEVVEAHHKAKKDAPSGTAKRLAEVLAATRKAAESACCGTSSPARMVPARSQPTNTIPVHAVRAGDIVGDHTVIFAGPAERLELTHRAHSRDVFAQGALRAAQFVHRQGPGLYDMSHVLKAAVTC